MYVYIFLFVRIRFFIHAASQLCETNSKMQYKSINMIDILVLLDSAIFLLDPILFL